MKTFWIAKGIKIIVLVALVGTIMSYAIMMLWNWLMPVILGASMINIWQAAGILVLSKLLFGFSRGWGGHHWGHQRHYQWKEKMEEKLKNMTPEERDKFRAEWKQRCGGWKHHSWGDERKVGDEVKM